MSTNIVFKRKTLKLPCRKECFQTGKTVSGFLVENILSIDKQKTVFKLNNNAVLCVRHEGYQLPLKITDAAKRGTKGLVKIIEVGNIDGSWYTIDQQLSPLPEWKSLSPTEKKELVLKMAKAIDRLHNLGFCHLDIKPEHFGLDSNNEVCLIDLDSARRYTGDDNIAIKVIEYSPEYAAPELFLNRFSTASDFYSFGKVIQELKKNELNSFFTRMVKKLTTPDPSQRYNYTQLCQYINDSQVERDTGARTYESGKSISGRVAFSDKQLALYLSENYNDAVRYVRETQNSFGNTDAKSVALLIHSLDRELPLYWYGQKIESTKDIAMAMSVNFPEKNQKFVELISSGVLLEFSQIRNVGNEVCALLQNAITSPEENYWRISHMFGGKYRKKTQKSLSLMPQKLKQLDSLLKSAIYFSDPPALVSVIYTISQKPSSENIDTVISMIQALPLSQSERNLTNVTPENIFGKIIETQLPSPGNYKNIERVSDIFDGNTLYIISSQSFLEWKQTNLRQKELKHQRNIAVGKAIGWTALGAAILAILPYILSALAAIAIIVFIFSLLF